MHNEFSATEAALSFTELAIRKGRHNAFASDLVQQLQIDVRELRREQLSLELAAAVRAKQKSIARRLLTELMKLTDDAKERHDFQTALRKLNEQQTAARIKYGFFAAFAVAAMLFLANSNGNKPATPGSLNNSNSAGSDNPAARSGHSDSQAPPAYTPPAPPAHFFSPPPGPAPAGANSTAYGQGQDDRRDWDAWFRGLERGTFREGAEWWASVRGVARPPSCNNAPGLDRAAATAGCIAARTRLANVVRRHRG